MSEQQLNTHQASINIHRGAPLAACSPKATMCRHSALLRFRVYKQEPKWYHLPDLQSSKLSCYTLTQATKNSGRSGRAIYLLFVGTDCFLLGFHNLLRILGMMSSVGSMGNATGQLHSDNGGWFLPAQMNWELCASVSYLQAGVGLWMADAVKSPWLRRGVNRFPLEFRGQTIGPGKLEYSHGNRTLSSTTRYIQWKRLNKSTANKCRLLFKFLLYNQDRQ